jgi:hypothetical protein
MIAVALSKNESDSGGENRPEGEEKIKKGECNRKSRVGGLRRPDRLGELP